MQNPLIAIVLAMALATTPARAEKGTTVLQDPSAAITSTSGGGYAILGYVLEKKDWLVKIGPKKDAATLPEFSPGDTGDRSPNWVSVNATPCVQGTPVKKLKVGDRVFAVAAMMENELGASLTWLLIQKTDKELRYDPATDRWVNAPKGDMEKFLKCSFE